MRRRQFEVITLAVLLAFGGIAGRADARAPAASKSITAVNVDPNNGIYGWSPKKVTVKVGTRVVWTNSSDTGHNIASTTKGWKFTKDLQNGDTRSYTFKKAGVYKYSCTIHPGMTGKITVK